jgi:putative ABC transport system permease protein
MFKNFLKITIRNIAKHKGFSFINISGLTLGLTACLLIGLFVHDEYQYDKFVPDGDRIFRIYDQRTGYNGTELTAVTPPMYSNTFRKFPEVEQTARVMMLPSQKILFEANGKKLYEESGFYVDSTFFQVFTLPFKFGAGNRALQDPTSIVLSQEMSARFFGAENPVGRQILMNKTVFVVKAVFEANSRFHLQFNYLIPLGAAGIPADRMASWQWHQFFTYIKTKGNPEIKELQSRFQNEVKQKMKVFDKERDIQNIPFFQKLKDIHLFSSNFKFDMAQRGNITYVNALMIIASIIMIIACFNFVNLSTARSLQRAKEVGILKTIGAERRQLILQFTGETFILTMISTIISVFLCLLILPGLNEFTGKQINNSVFFQPVTILLFGVLVIVVSVGAGFYPAVVLSGFKPVKVLKSNSFNGENAGKTPWLRNGMVVAQFTLTVLLIICTLVVFRQVDYLHNKDLGFNKDQIMFFPMRGDNMFRNYESFKNELQKSSGIQSVSIGYGFPGDAVAGDEIIVDHKGEKQKQSAVQLMVDYDYVTTLNLHLVSGRNFSKEMRTDRDHAFIINETAVKQLGFGTAQRALGQTLEWQVWNDKNPDSLKAGQVIGVVQDFNFKSLYDKMETTVLQIYPDAYWKVAVKMKGSNISNTIDYVKNIWAKFTPEYPIEYKFMDENFVQIYKSEDKLKSLLWIFASLAIFIGCMGLFGLASFTTERRKKEIGIRKLLGASTGNLVFLLSRDFTKLVVIALCIASPVAYYYMNKWLNGFAYRVGISWWIFAVAAILALTIAFATVSFKAIKVAISNPVNNLKTE